MGREAIATCHWRGEAAEVKALLEGREIILRGAIRLRLDRAACEAMAHDGDDLILTTGGERLVLALGEVEAAKWLAKLQAPLPTLAQKLGLSAAKPALVIGTLNDPELAQALAGGITSEPDRAALLIAMIECRSDLAAALALAQTKPQLHIWCVYPKGKAALVSDAEIRTTMRAAGLMDNKTCAVSERLTATRYRAKASN